MRVATGTSLSELERLRSLLDQTQHDAERERTFLADQHDAFIASLIEDHEHEMHGLRAELDEARRERDAALAGPANDARQLEQQLAAAEKTIEKLVIERERTREALLRLQSQRDEAQATVVKLTRERDQGRSEMAQLKIQQGMSEAIREGAASERPSQPLSRPPIPALSALKPSVRTQPAPSSSSPTARPPAASPTANAPTVRPMTSAAAGNGQRPLAAQVASTRSTAPAPSRLGVTRPGQPDPVPAIPPPGPLSDKPPSGPLKSKPDPSTRPLVGYSMTETSEERVDTSRMTSPTRPPKI